MAKVALITGITGQDGSYLTEFLLKAGYEVHGLIRRTATPNVKNIHHLVEKIHLKICDITDPVNVMDSIMSIEPDEIYHLAAQSFVGTSWDEPYNVINTNEIGTLNVLEACKSLNKKKEARMYNAASSEMFGKTDGKSLNENTIFNPRSPYGISKASAYYYTKNFRESYGIFAVSGILGNHESPRRGAEFFTRKVTMHVGMIVAGKIDSISLGNLDAVRDWGYSPDYVLGMMMMLQNPTPEDFVLGTGECHSCREWVAESFRCAGIDDYEKYIKIDPRFMRKADVEHLRLDYTKAQETLGWKPKVKFKELAKIMTEADIELFKE